MNASHLVSLSPHENWAIIIHEWFWDSCSYMATKSAWYCGTAITMMSSCTPAGHTFSIKQAATAPFVGELVGQSHHKIIMQTLIHVTGNYCRQTIQHKQEFPVHMWSACLGALRIFSALIQFYQIWMVHYRLLYLFRQSRLPTGRWNQYYIIQHSRGKEPYALMLC